MRLAGFNYSTPAIYYITVCTQNREPILWTSETINISVGNSERQILKPELSETGLITEEFVRQIPGLEKYVIMPNHVHMIIRIREKGETPVTSRIRTFKTFVTREVGENIWQRSFYDEILRTDKCRRYIEICTYIDENPINWIIDEYHN